MMKIQAFALAALAASALIGCASQPVTMYGWGSYQTQVYEHFKAEKSSPEQQLAALEKDREQILAKGQALPPGYRAHIGYLYAQLGRIDEAQQQFVEEKKVFPESAPYMDFLLKTPNKDKK
jgi:hypothetical protein